MPDNQIFKVGCISVITALTMLNTLIPYLMQATYSGIPVYEMCAI